MKLDEIKDGMVIQTKQGVRYLKIGGNFYNQNMDTYMECDEFDNDNLTSCYDDCFSICKVFKVKSDCSSLRDVFADCYLKLLWSRKEYFAKSKLKNGMIVQYRNGKKRIVIDNTLCGFNDDDCGCFTDFKSNYDENLQYKNDDSDLDIVKVYKCNIANLTQCGELLWEEV